MSILQDFQSNNDPRNNVPPIVPPPTPRVDTPPAQQPLTAASQALDSRDALITPGTVQESELLQNFAPVDALETQIPEAPPDFSAFQTREEVMAPFDQQAQAELTQFFTQAADDAAQADIVNSHLPTLFGGMSAADRAMADRYASRIGELIKSSNQVIQPAPPPVVSPQNMGPIQANRPFGFDQDNLASPKKTLGNPFMMDDKDKSEFAPRQGKFGQFGQGPLGGAFYALNAVFGTPVAGVVDIANTVFAGHSGNIEAMQTDVDAKNPVDWVIKKSKLARELATKNLSAQYPTGHTYAQQVLLGRDLGSLGASLNGAEEDAYARRYGSLSPLAYGLDTIIGTKDEDYDKLYASKLPKPVKDTLATFKGVARTATGLFVDVVVAPDNIGDLARPLAKAMNKVNRSIGMARQLPYGQFTPNPRGIVPYKPQPGTVVDTYTRTQPVSNNGVRVGKGMTIPDLEAEVLDIKALPDYFRVRDVTVLPPNTLQGGGGELANFTTIDVHASVVRELTGTPALKVTTQPVPVKSGLDTHKILGYASDTKSAVIEVAPYEFKVVRLEDFINQELLKLNVSPAVLDEAPSITPVVSDYTGKAAMEGGESASSLLQLPGSMPIAALPPAVRRVVTRPSAITNDVLIPEYSAPKLPSLREMSNSTDPIKEFGEVVGGHVARYKAVRDTVYNIAKPVLERLGSGSIKFEDLRDGGIRVNGIDDINRLTKEVGEVVDLDSLAIRDNLSTTEQIVQLDAMLRGKLAEKPAHIKHVLMGHGTGTFTGGDWRFEKGVGIQDYVDANYPKGTKVHVLACETCMKKNIGMGWDAFREVVSRGDDVSQEVKRAEAAKKGLRYYSNGRGLLLDAANTGIAQATRNQLAARAENRINKALKILEEFGITERNIEEFRKHVESGRDPNFFVSKEAATSQPPSAVAASPTSGTLTPAAVASDASGIITVKPGESQAPKRVKEGDTKSKDVADAEAIGLRDTRNATLQLERVAAHMTDGLSLEEAVSKVNSGTYTPTKSDLRKLQEVHESASSLRGVEATKLDYTEIDSIDALKRRNASGRDVTPEVARITDEVRSTLGFDSLRLHSNKNERDQLITLEALINQGMRERAPSNFRNVLMGHGSGSVADGTWRLDKETLVQDYVNANYPEGTLVHVFACESCFTRSLGSPYFWESFVGVTSSKESTPVSVVMQRFYKTYNPSELPQLIAEAAKVPGMKFNGKVSIPKARPAKVIHRLASLIPHPDGSGAPLLSPLKADVEAFVSKYGVPHPYADYAKAAPRVLTGGGGKRKSITDLAADIGNLYGSFYQRILSPSGEPISDELLEALESGHATGKGILLDLDGEKAIKVEAPKVVEAPKTEPNLDELRTQKVNEYAAAKGVAPELVVITDSNNGKLNWNGKGQPSFSVFGTAEQATARRAKLTDATTPSITPSVSKGVDLDKLRVKADALMDSAETVDDLYKVLEKVGKKVVDEPDALKFMNEIEEMAARYEKRLLHPFGEADTKMLDNLADEVATVVANEAEITEALDATTKAELNALDEDFDWDFEGAYDYTHTTQDMNPSGSGATIKIEDDRVIKSGLEPEQYGAEVKALELLGGEEAPRLISAHDGDVVMERIHGTPLSELSVSSYSDGEKLGAKVGKLLTAVHSKGVVHNDMHWYNIILTDSGDLKLIDFNLAATKSQMSESIWQRATSDEAYKAELYPELTGEALDGYLEGFRNAYKAPSLVATDDYTYLQKLLQNVNRATVTGEDAKDFLAQYKDALTKAGADARAVSEGLTDQLFDAFDNLRKAQKDVRTKTERVQLEEGKNSYKSELDRAANDNGVC